MSLAVVRDLRERRSPASPEELAQFETDVLAGFVLARASAGLADGTISSDVGHLEQVRTWFGKPLWDMEPADADTCFGKVLRTAAKGTRLARAQAVTTFFAFLELRHKVEIHALTGRIVECPIDEMNKPRGRKQAALRIPPTDAEVTTLFAGWRGELVTCRKFAPTARNFVAAKLMSQVGLRVNEARSLDLADVKWELGRFGKLHVRIGKGARGSGPRERGQHLFVGVHCGHRQHRWRLRQAADLRGGRDPVHLWHSQVHQHDVGLVPDRGLGARGAVIGHRVHDDPAGVGQDRAQELTDHGLVIDHDDMHDIIGSQLCCVGSVHVPSRKSVRAAPSRGRITCTA